MPKDDDADAADPPVPRIPYSRGLKLSWGEMIRIALTAAMLVMIIMWQKPCADSMSKFVTGFDDGSGVKARKQGELAPTEDTTRYQRIDPNTTPEQLKAIIDKSKADAAAGSN